MLRGEWKPSCSDQTYRMDLSLLNCCFWSSPLTTPAPNFHLFHVRMMPAFEHIGDTACLCCTFYKNVMIGKAFITSLFTQFSSCFLFHIVSWGKKSSLQNTSHHFRLPLTCLHQPSPGWFLHLHANTLYFSLHISLITKVNIYSNCPWTRADHSKNIAITSVMRFMDAVLHKITGFQNSETKILVLNSVKRAMFSLKIHIKYIM